MTSHIIVTFLFPVVSGGEHVDVIIGGAVADGKVTPKVQSLVKILHRYQSTGDFRAIIFVERVVTALVLPKVHCCTSYCLDSNLKTNCKLINSRTLCYPMFKICRYSQSFHL